MKQAANIAAVANLHPDYLGFIFYEKSPRYISAISAELIKYVPHEIKTVGVFVDEDLEKVKSLVLKHHLKVVQLHGKENINYCVEIRKLGVEVIKAFGVHPDFDFSTLELYEPVVDYFLFDTQTPAHGGSGKVFDWKLLENYQLQKPYFLSGGIDLNHANQIKEIEDERLYAIDINSKFELEPGLKDVDKLKEFFEKVSMSVMEKYGVWFDRLPKCGTVEIIKRPDIENNSLLHFISRLCEHETDCFIDDLNRSIKLKVNVDEGFFSDSVEDMDILYQYPNVSIHDLGRVLTIPMHDLKILLEKWSEFNNYKLRYN